MLAGNLYPSGKRVPSLLRTCACSDCWDQIYQIYPLASIVLLCALMHSDILVFACLEVQSSLPLTFLSKPICNELRNDGTVCYTN